MADSTELSGLLQPVLLIVLLPAVLAALAFARIMANGAEEDTGEHHHAHSALALSALRTS